MKAGGMFISAILIVDTFFVSYYLGVHSRTVDVEDSSIKPVKKPLTPAPKLAPKKIEAPKTTPETKKGEGKTKAGATKPKTTKAKAKPKQKSGTKPKPAAATKKKSEK